MKTIKIIAVFLFCFFTAIFAISTTQPVNAELTSGETNSFSQNNITGWNPAECDSESGTAGNISVCNANLPSETIKMLEDDGVKKKAQENMERYKYAEEKTGVAWQAVAALHWREGSMDPGSSISNGEPLSSGGCYSNVDGVQICSDPNKDAETAAKSLLEDGKSIYNVDIVKNPDMDSYGYAFLAYNRGYMYKCNGNVSYKKSPYVMNYYDKEHWQMTWLNGADDTDCNGNVLNNVGGSTNQQLGALTVLAYLCGEGTSTSSDTSSSSSSSKKSSSDSKSSDSKSSDSKSSDSKSSDSKSSSAGPISGAKNAKKQASQVGRMWFDDNSTDTMKTLLQNYGDLAYRTGKKYNVPWIAILVQGRYEDSNAACGKNNFWGIGCYPGTGEGGAISAANVGEGFELYGKTVHNGKYKKALQQTDPWEYLRALGPVWVQGNENGPGYGSIKDMKNSINALTKYIKSPEGQKVVAEFGGTIDDTCTTYEGEYPEYIQYGQSWSSQSYNGGDIGDSGCGPSSMAMIATVAAGQDIYPNDIVDITSPHGNYVYTSGSGMTELDKVVGEKYGFEVINVDYSSLEDAESKMRKYLEDGYLLHFSGAGGAPFTSGGHYVGAFAINGDTVKVADSNLGNKDYNLHDLVQAGLHGGAFSASMGGGNRNSCSSNACPERGGSGSDSLKTGGFDSVDEADKTIMDPYRDLAANRPGEWGKYNIAAGTPYNCFSFSNYFITKYTTIKNFYGVPGVDGGGYAEEFYNLYHDEYPDLKISSTPTPYSVAGCGDKYYAGDGSASHTFIVLGVDSAKKTMIYGEAAYGSGEEGIKADEININANDGYHTGPRCKYTDFSKYVKGI